MSETLSSLTELTADECRSLLVTHRPRLGRLAFVDAGWPMVFPMNYVATGDCIYLRSAPGSKLLAALRVQQVSFEVDHVDEVWEEGWSVLVLGRLRLVNDTEELADVRQLPLRPWARGDRPHFLRIDTDRISGRRIV